MSIIRRKTLLEIINDKLDEYDETTEMFMCGISYTKRFIKNGKLSLSMYHSLVGSAVNKKPISQYNIRRCTIVKPLSDVSKLTTTKNLDTITSERFHLSQVSEKYTYDDIYSQHLSELRYKIKRRLRRYRHDGI